MEILPRENMEMYALIFTVIVSPLRLYGLFVSPADALTCLSCDTISHPRNCHVVSQCGPREVCYQKSITAADHSKAYELGCTDPSLNKNVDGYCNSTILDASGQRCYECCNTDLCNSQLCGQRGYPKDRGPICYACNSRLRGEICNFIDFCERDEVCSVNQRLEFSEVVYTNECSQKHVCEGHSLAFVGKRTIPVCNACCTSDLCNVNCTNHSHTDYCSDDTCKNGGLCENGTFGYICHCPDGFGGKNCDPDPCQSSPCKNGGGCMTVTSGYVCVCQQGFIGSNCESGQLLDSCQSGPCLNNGTCSFAGSSYSCACPAGFLGQNCEIDACQAAPCYNGGTCSLVNGTFSCKCPDGVAGDRCEIDPCSGVHCQNGARCQGFGSSGYVCVCVLGYSGVHCEVDSCTSGPCQNGGTCTVVANNYTCTCPNEFTGDTCERDPCQLHNCSNGGTCHVHQDGFTCTCSPYFTGRHCEIGVCSPGACQNGGTCLDGVGGYKCICLPLFKGADCEIALCTGGTCKNGGTCLDTAQGYQCTCPPGYAGRQCEAVTTCGSDPGAVNAIQVTSLWLPSTDRIIRVPCDVKTDGGGWLIFQNRFDGSVSFHRNFSEYEQGFGDASGEFWLGLNDTYAMMAQCPGAVWELRIDLVDANNLPGFEHFQSFSLAPPPRYTLYLGQGSGTAIRYSTQDLGLAYHNSSDFSTYDHDTTKSNCTALDLGGWWYYNCAYVNLNGVYLQPPGTIATDHHGGESGMIYFSFDRTRSLRSSQMKIRVLPGTKC